jgi:site-specific DNA-adenine methylase
MLLRNPGSKWRVAPVILSLRPRSCIEYREPFCASAAVFWRLHEGGFPHRWLNDVNSNVIRAYATLQDDYDGSHRRAILALRTGNNDPEVVQRNYDCAHARISLGEHSALDYLCLNRYSLCGMVLLGRRHVASIDARTRGCIDGRQDGMAALTPTRLDYAHARSQGVRLTNGDFEPMLMAPAENGPVWAYIDPPYLLTCTLSPHGRVYANEMNHEDHERLFRVLTTCGHRWLMTINSCRYVVRRYIQSDHQSPFRSRKGFNVLPLPTRYGGVPRWLTYTKLHNRKRSGPLVEELMIWNYDE